MSEITLTLPDGKAISAAKGASLLEAAGDGIPSDVIAAKVGGELVDLNRPLDDGGCVELIKISSDEGMEILRHSVSHVMAQAVKELYPDAKVTIGPAIKNGFYYDFEYPPGFNPEDLEKIEKRMAEIVKDAHRFERKEVTRDEAIKLFESKGESYKVELIKDLPEDEKLSIYEQGSFVDLCRGPHIPGTNLIKAFKLTSVAGAYWRGDERNTMLQRIYGTAFPNRKELKAHLLRLEEAKKRDHRILGKALDLFSIHEEVGPGMPIYHPKGMILRNILEDFERREHRRRGYEQVMGPILLKKDLWVKSGHMDNFKENMYFTEVEGDEYGIKPMNCLAHMLIYKTKVRSYRELPKRYFELGICHRHEKSGVLHGLTRVRAFTQDDAHIICMPEQLEDEISDVMQFVRDVMAMFEFEFTLKLSTRPDKAIGSDEMWEKATGALKSVLDSTGLPYGIDEGEGAFYGPKIDVKLKDALDREWQCATIQCDFALPERFELEYVGKDNRRHRPVMLHRVILGAIDRFIGVLIEHYAGAFPPWLSPVQAKVLTVTENQNAAAEKVHKELLKADIRVEVDIRNEKLGYKIREAQMEKVPYMLVIGEREAEAGNINVRARDGRKHGEMKTEEFVKLVKDSYPQMVL